MSKEEERSVCVCVFWWQREKRQSLMTDRNTHTHIETMHTHFHISLFYSRNNVYGHIHTLWHGFHKKKHHTWKKHQEVLFNRKYTQIIHSNTTFFFFFSHMPSLAPRDFLLVWANSRAAWNSLTHLSWEIMQLACLCPPQKYCVKEADSLSI